MLKRRIKGRPRSCGIGNGPDLAPTSEVEKQHRGPFCAICGKDVSSRVRRQIAIWKGPNKGARFVACLHCFESREKDLDHIIERALNVPLAFDPPVVRVAGQPGKSFAMDQDGVDRMILNAVVCLGAGFDPTQRSIANNVFEKGPFFVSEPLVLGVHYFEETDENLAKRHRPLDIRDPQGLLDEHPWVRDAIQEAAIRKGALQGCMIEIGNSGPYYITVSYIVNLGFRILREMAYIPIGLGATRRKEVPNRLAGMVSTIERTAAELGLRIDPLPWAKVENPS